MRVPGERSIQFVHEQRFADKAGDQVGEKSDAQPRPMKGIFVAITVMNCTLAFNGRLAM